MTPVIQFTVQSHWKHAKVGSGVTVSLKLRAKDEKDLRQAGVLSMTDTAWNMLQEQLCPSYHSGQCAVELIDQDDEW